MAGNLRRSRKGEATNGFRHSHALIIGINDYGNGLRPLTTPVNDATRLARLLEEEHGYRVHLLVKGVTKARMQTLLTEKLPPQISGNDRLLLCFAGHGVALDGDDGPQGFVPQDANAAEQDTLPPTTNLRSWLDDLSCRHMLAVLDSCLAGAFRWAAIGHLERDGLEMINSWPHCCSSKPRLCSAPTEVLCNGYWIGQPATYRAGLISAWCQTVTAKGSIPWPSVQKEAIRLSRLGVTACSRAH